MVMTNPSSTDMRPISYIMWASKVLRSSAEALPARASSKIRSASALSSFSVAGVATGVAYQLAQNATIDQFTQEGCYVEGNSVQATANKSSLTQCQSLHDRSGTQKTVSLVGYIGGAALAITSTIVFLLSARSSEAP